MWRDNLIIVLICISLRDVEHLCMFLLAMSSLEKYLFSLLPIFCWVVCFLLLSYMSYFCILEVKPLSVALFANIFSCSIDFFILFMVSFVVQNLKSLTRSHLFLFVFISVALETDLRKHCCNLCQNVLPMFSPRSSMVSCLSFQAILSLFLGSVWGCVLTSLIYMWLSSFLNTTCWRDCLLCCILLPFVED